MGTYLRGSKNQANSERQAKSVSRMARDTTAA
jgi:hypothetical protein